VVAPPAKKTVTLELDDNGCVVNFDAVGELRVPIKVDGRESVETLHGLRRGYQLDSHLNQKGQRIGEQLAALKALEKDMVERANAGAPRIESDDPAVQELVRQHDQLKKTIAELETKVSTPVSEPARVPSRMAPEQQREENIRLLRTTIEARGHKDFDKYFPRLESLMLSLPPEQQKRFQSVETWVAEYADMKLKDLTAGIPVPVSPGGPPVGANVTIVEPGGGGGGPAPTAVEAWQRRRDAQLKLAKELSNDPQRSSLATQAWVALDQINNERPSAGN